MPTSNALPPPLFPFLSISTLDLPYQFVFPVLLSAWSSGVLTSTHVSEYSSPTLLWANPIIQQRETNSCGVLCQWGGSQPWLNILITRRYSELTGPGWGSGRNISPNYPTAYQHWEPPDPSLRWPCTDFAALGIKSPCKELAERREFLWRKGGKDSKFPRDIYSAYFFYKPKRGTTNNHSFGM